jgi:hypothetical protein
MKKLLLTVAVLVMLGSTAHADDKIPAAFHGTWCAIKDADDFRRGACRDGIRIHATGYTHRTGNCRITESKQVNYWTLIVTFLCRSPGDPKAEYSSLCFMKDRYTAITSNVQMCQPQKKWGKTIQAIASSAALLHRQPGNAL